MDSRDERSAGGRLAAGRAGLPRAGAYLSRLAAFFHAQCDEIAADPALRLYGAGLALAHILIFLYWRETGVQSVLARGTEPICWPLVPGCAALRVFSAGQMHRLLLAYALLALMVAPFFAWRRRVPQAYAGLFLLVAVEFGIMSLDYRMRSNQSYMAFWATAAFLLMPGKRDVLRVVIVLFYVWAGTLKLNVEWLSGAALDSPLWLVPSALVPAACAYVVVLELGVVWGLLANRSWVFWSAFTQVALFHVMSWAIVGFYYPLLMGLLIAIFPLTRLIPDGRMPGLFRTFVGGRARLGTYAAAGIFSFAQVVPYTFPGDRALTGEGRLYALHMFDARVTCEMYAVVHDRTGATRQVDLRLKLIPRITCDPVVAYNRARNLCEGRSSIPLDVADLDLHVWARRTSETVMHEVVNLPGFCARGPRYRPFRHNDWILTQ